MMCIPNLTPDDAKRVLRTLPLPAPAFLTVKFFRRKKLDIDLPEPLKKYKVSPDKHYEILKFDSDEDPVTYDELVSIIDNSTDQLLEVNVQAKTYDFKCELLSRKLTYNGPDAHELLKEWNGLGIAFREIIFKSEKY